MSVVTVQAAPARQQTVEALHQEVLDSLAEQPLIKYADAGGWTNEELSFAARNVTQTYQSTVSALTTEIDELTAKAQLLEATVNALAAPAEPITTALTMQRRTSAQLTNLKDALSNVSGFGTESDPFEMGLVDPYPAVVYQLRDVASYDPAPLISAGSVNYVAPTRPTKGCGDLRLAVIWPSTARGGFTLALSGTLLTTADLGHFKDVAAAPMHLRLLPLANSDRLVSEVSTYLVGEQMHNNAYEQLRTWQEVHRIRVRQSTLFGHVSKTIKVTVVRTEYIPGAQLIIERPVVADALYDYRRPGRLYVRVADLGDTASERYPWRGIVLSLRPASGAHVLASRLVAQAITSHPALGPLRAGGGALVVPTDRACPVERGHYTQEEVSALSSLGVSNSTQVGDAWVAPASTPAVATAVALGTWTASESAEGGLLL